MGDHVAGVGDNRGGWLRSAAFLCALIFAYWALVSAAPLFPKGRLALHLREACRLFTKEGQYWRPFGQMPLANNFTDSIALNITGSLDPDDPLRSAMRMDVSFASGDRTGGSPLHDFENFTAGRADAKSPYSRYWHGYVVLLRPLLSFMSYADVRKLMFFASTLIFIGALLLLHRRTDGVTAFAFAAGYAATRGSFGSSCS
ncbi:MAG: hypothetical protein LBR38_00230 [Synergistaceae bacterium]|jgi:hypothetical protein|nr:hypothetical protein [Synergistaceae bacterium]